MVKTRKQSTRKTRAITSAPVVSVTSDQSETASSNTPTVSIVDKFKDANVKPVSEFERTMTETLKNLTTRNYSCSALEGSVPRYQGLSTGCPDLWLEKFHRYAELKQRSITHINCQSTVISSVSGIHRPNVVWTPGGWHQIQLWHIGNRLLQRVHLVGDRKVCQTWAAY